MSNKAAFLDRDGTINVDHGYVHKEHNFELIPGVLGALKELNKQDIDIYIVTNQSGIARGLYTEDDFNRITEHMLDLFAVEGIKVNEVLYCPHHVEGEVEEYRQACDCRKPQPGMLQRVIAKKGYKTQNMVMIGDKNSDVDAGKKLGIKTYLVETGHGQKEKSKTKADYVLPDLKSCIEHLLKRSDF